MYRDSADVKVVSAGITHQEEAAGTLSQKQSRGAAETQDLSGHSGNGEGRPWQLSEATLRLGPQHGETPAAGPR